MHKCHVFIWFKEVKIENKKQYEVKDKQEQTECCFFNIIISCAILFDPFSNKVVLYLK